MTPEEALIELFGRVGANRGSAVLINDGELSQWPSVAIAAMKSQKLIAPARPAPSVICPGCENDCVMPVHTPPVTTEPSASFIVCDKRSDTNRVQVSPELLIQWQCSIDLVIGFIATNLGLRRSTRQTSRAGLREIGIATGYKRSQMLCLQTRGELALVAGDSKIPVAELVAFRNGKFVLHADMVRRLVDAATTADERYTPSDDKREARKLQTQVKHEIVQNKYRELKRLRPEQTDKLIAQQIFKLKIVQGLTVETIRKNMKK